MPELTRFYGITIRIDQVRLDMEAHTLVWPNDADFDPETLRNWPDYKDAWIAAAQRFALVTA